jgi:hypothetical protein
MVRRVVAPPATYFRKLRLLKSFMKLSLIRFCFLIDQLNGDDRQMKPVKGFEYAAQTRLIHDPYQQPRGLWIACLDTGIHDACNRVLIQLPLHHNAVERGLTEPQKAGALGLFQCCFSPSS